MDLVGGQRSRREFEALVAQATPGLLHSAYLMCWDAAEAEDLLQETWLRVARQWPRVRRMDLPVAYVRRVLVNAVIDAAPSRQRRRKELQPDAADHGGAPGPEHLIDRPAQRSLDTVEDQQELRLALAELTVRQRAVLVLRYWEGRSEREVAQTLGCSVGTVKSTASRALMQLRASRAQIG